MIIAVDGPAASGKGTIARAIARPRPVVEPVITATRPSMRTSIVSPLMVQKPIF